MKELFKGFVKMGEDFQKMGDELARGFDAFSGGFDTTFNSFKTVVGGGDEDWTGTLRTETENFLLTIPVPGLSPTELDVRVFANKVRINVQKDGTKAKHDFELPEQIDAKLCLASLHRGVLTLKIQKTGIVSTGVKIEITEK